jgi:hypothetical protein
MRAARLPLSNSYLHNLHIRLSIIVDLKDPSARDDPLFGAVVAVGEVDGEMGGCGVPFVPVEGFEVCEVVVFELLAVDFEVGVEVEVRDVQFGLQQAEGEGVGLEFGVVVCQDYVVGEPIRRVCSRYDDIVRSRWREEIRQIRQRLHLR